MSGAATRDRRRSYSFIGRRKRVRTGRGRGRGRGREYGKLGVALLRTALFAGALLASCRSESLTGTGKRSAPTMTDLIGTTVADPSLSTDPSASFPYNGDDMNPCNGELVPAHGSATITAFTSSGDVFHQKFQIHWVLNGTGDLGNVYHGDDQFLEEMNVSFLPFEETIVQNVNMHSNTAPDYRSKMLLHLTVSGSGKPTATVSKATNDGCGQ
jgi:hypothetical protein